MDMGRQSTPEWMEAWLKVPFYEEKCRNHAKTHKTVYCGECMQGPFCYLCWKQGLVDQQHRHHRPILQVRIASRKAATAIEDMRGILDVSDIQRYKINHKYIVYLNPYGKCLECSAKSICDERFCSIACKFKSKEIVKERPKIILKFNLKRKKIECIPPEDLSLIPNLNLERKNEGSSTQSFRKRSRKGTPHRAPFK